MADWLTGRIKSRPGYQLRCGPDPETKHLVPTLATLCRAGYVTTGSQPGTSDRRSRQRAAIEGVVLDAALGQRLRRAAKAAGLLTSETDYGRTGAGERIAVTEVAGRAFTHFGGRMDDDEMSVQWDGLNPRLAKQLGTSTYLTIVAPEWGPAGERLWPILASAI